MNTAATSARTVRGLHAALLACALFGFPLASALPVFLGVDSRPISLVYRALIAVATVVLVGHALKTGRPFARRGHVLIALGMMAVPLARVAWDSAMAPLPLDLDWGEIWPFTIGAAFLPATAFLVQMDEPTRELARRWSLRLGLLAAASTAGVSVIVLRNVVEFVRLHTGVLNPISIGHFGVSLFVLVMLRHDTARPTAGTHRVAAALATGLGMLLAAALVLAAGSMGPTVAWAVVMAGWFLSQMRASLLAGRGILGLAVPISAVLLLVIGLFALNAVVPIPLVERMLDIATQQSTSERIGLLTRALAQFEESPLLGSSVFEFENRVYPHNVFVEALMIGGVVGLVPLVLLLYESGRTALSCLMRASADRWLALLFLQYFIDVMFSGSLYFSAPFWSVTFAMLGLAGAGTRVGGVGRQRGPRAAAAESGAATGAPGWT